MTIKTRLLAKRYIDPVTNCWLWTGSLDSSGRGQIYINGRKEMVSRASYEEFKGPLKNWALHIRECPNPHCFNPNHLYDGTHSDNQLDVCMTKPNYRFGGQVKKTYCKRGHELNNENSRNYKGRGKDCLLCARIRANERRIKLKNKLSL